MLSRPGPVTPRACFQLILVMLGMIAVPATLTLHTAKVSSVVDVSAANPTPHGYTISLLLFIVPILVIGLWLVPQEGIKVSKKAFAWTLLVLFPLGAGLDFFFANRFLTFGNPGATLRVLAPALPKWVPVEEYVFYFTGFVAVLLLYIWLDEYWLAAYSVGEDDARRMEFDRLLRFHPESLAWGVAQIVAGLVCKSLTTRYLGGVPGFPGYFTFLVLTAVLPSMALLPGAMPMVNWRAFSLTMFMISLISVMWEATLAVPYHWWGYQPQEMLGLTIRAWGGLPIEAVMVWLTVSYTTVIVYETIKRWKASGREARAAFLGLPGGRDSPGVIDGHAVRSGDAAGCSGECGGVSACLNGDPRGSEGWGGG